MESSHSLTLGICAVGLYVSIYLLLRNLLPTLFIRSKQSFIGCFMVFSRFILHDFYWKHFIQEFWRHLLVTMMISIFSEHNTVGRRWQRPLTHSWSLHRVAAHSWLHDPRVPKVKKQDSPTHLPHSLIMHCTVTVLNEYYCLTIYVDQLSSTVAHSCLRREPISYSTTLPWAVWRLRGREVGVGGGGGRETR